MEEKKTYKVKCNRCTKGIETTTPPSNKMTGFLCNSCHLGWKDIESKLVGHTYADEMRDAFIQYVNSLAHLRNFNLK